MRYMEPVVVRAAPKKWIFMRRNLTTACRAEASSEGGMDTDGHGFFARKNRLDIHQPFR